jgi:mono/diheme cytochrome c family protein
VACTLRLILMFCCSLGCLAQAQDKPAPARGELLYATHCIACHNTQLHWRNKHLATSWSRLKAEVDRWQKAAALGWRDEEVTEVARYLNARYYHFPAPLISNSTSGKVTKLSSKLDQ